jgi:hypothetical protein
MALTYCRVDPEGVAIRNWPRHERRIALDEIEEFNVLRASGEIDRVRSPLAFFRAKDRLTVFLKNGQRVRVRAYEGDNIAAAALRLNNELARYR